jgi:hypothetical protein
MELISYNYSFAECVTTSSLEILTPLFSNSYKVNEHRKFWIRILIMVLCLAEFDDTTFIRFLCKHIVIRLRNYLHC